MQQPCNTTWEELVAQVSQGASAEEALGLREPQDTISVEEFWDRLVVKGVGDTPLPFLPPDLSQLLPGVGAEPREDYVVLPPCMCLDSLLKPEFVLPPHGPEEEENRSSKHTPPQEEVVETEKPPTKRKRLDSSPELVADKEERETLNSSVELVSTEEEVIDLTQD